MGNLGMLDGAKGDGLRAPGRLLAWEIFNSEAPQRAAPYGAQVGRRPLSSS